ncbi:hypothetical protein H0H93_008655, partial [Arthromyces matolae]
MVRLYQGLSTFADDHEQFQSFLRDHLVEKTAASCGVKLRGINRVHPKPNPTESRGTIKLYAPEYTIETYK